MTDIDLENERQFENLKMRDPFVRASQDKFYWATHLDIQEHEDNIQAAVAGGTILEIGCSRGDQADIYCQACSNYFGLDIADEAICLAQAKGLENAVFICGDGHSLPFEDNLFDCVIVNSLLHHLSLDVVIPEIKRVLKPTGKLCFREPLNGNFLFSLYRHFTPQARTIDEKPFSTEDLILLGKYFDLSGIRYFGCCVLVSALVRVTFLRYLLRKIDWALEKSPFRNVLFWQVRGIVEPI